MVSIKLQTTVLKPSKAMLNKSSNLSENLERWENFARIRNFAHYSYIVKDRFNLNEYIEFNYFNGYKWTNLIIE